MVSKKGNMRNDQRHLPSIDIDPVANEYVAPPNHKEAWLNLDTVAKLAKHLFGSSHPPCGESNERVIRADSFVIEPLQFLHHGKLEFHHLLGLSCCKARYNQYM